MNERQRDLFLWIWSRRRKPGQLAIAFRGAAIGALGGLIFALILAPNASAPGVPAHDALGQIMSAGGLLVMSIAAFAGIGFVLANRVFASQEAMYQAMLSSGARVPEAKPAMQPADRWPALAVAITAAVIAGFILYLFITLG